MQLTYRSTKSEALEFDGWRSVPKTPAPSRIDLGRIPSSERKRVAIVHDWLPLYGGAERVLEQILRVYPEADLFSMIDAIPQAGRGFLLHKPVRTSFVQRLPLAKTRYRSYLPLMPLAVEQFDLRGYDLVISSSYAVAKGVITGPGQLHVCYCHSPMRYAWDLQGQYLEEAGLTRGIKSLLARALLHYVRLWDVRTAAGVDHFIANSRFVARRIGKVYRREATVVYPPVDVETFHVGGKREPYFLAASRMVPYKRMDLIAEAFSMMPDRQLKIVGDGPELAKVKAKAGPNVELLGYRSNGDLRELMQQAQAFVFAAEEDFGIMPVEAQACGTPVIAFGKGGVRETVLSGKTGLFFDEQTPESLCRAIEAFDEMPVPFESSVIRKHAEQFSPNRFRHEFSSFVSGRWEEFQRGSDDHHLNGSLHA